jgi:hypothetical protein
MISSRHDSRKSEHREEINAELTRRKTLAFRDGGVGDEEDSRGGFGIGIAPRESKPVTKLEMMGIEEFV